MSVRVNVHMSKIMRTLIRVGERTYATYANYLTLDILFVFNGRRCQKSSIGDAIFTNVTETLGFVLLISILNFSRESVYL